MIQNTKIAGFDKHEAFHSILQIRFPVQAPVEKIEKEEGRFRLYPGKERTYYLTQRSLDALKKFTDQFEIVKEVSYPVANIDIYFSLEATLHERPTDSVCEEIVAFALSRRERGKPYYPEYCGRTREDIAGSFVMDIPGGIRNYRWRWTERKARKRSESFKDRFPRLIKRIKDPDTRFVVSLGGGGLLLFAHPSIFKIIEALGARESIEEIWGCSGGAIAGMAYSLGADHKIIEQEGYDLYNRKYSLELSPSKIEVIKNLVLSRVLPGSTMSLRGFVDIHNSMQESLARVCKHRKALFPFFALAYNLNTNKNEVLTPMAVPPRIYEGFIRRCSPIDSVLASAAIPILFVPRVIRRGHASYTFIDGSLFEEVPLTSVYHKWILDKRKHLTRKKKLFILCVNLFPYLSTQKFFGDMLIRHLPILELGTVLLRLADLMRRVRIDDSFKSINSDLNATAIEVRLPKLSKYNFLNPQIIPTVIDRARATFFQQLLKIEANL